MSTGTKPAVRDKDAALIFLHLPKCAGTTLNRIIEWEYDPMRVFSIDPILFLWSYKKLNQWPAKRLGRMQVFKGHMPFGIHRRLPQPSTYITFLRDPVERVISAYYFARNYLLHPKHRWISKLSLEEYVQVSPNHNVQCKYISGRSFVGDFHAGDCDTGTLEMAKENLNRYFSLVGLTERFDEGLAILKSMFGWEISKYAKFNVTKSRQAKDSLPASTVELIAERNKYDVALYESAVAIFNETCAKYGSEVQKQIGLISQAKALTKPESIYYFCASEARKAISRIHSAL
jgi:Galactose-3-O-sulfotransferase